MKRAIKSMDLKLNTELCERRYKKPLYLVNIKISFYPRSQDDNSSSPRMQLSRNCDLGNAFQWNNGITQSSFSPDVLGVIFDDLQPQQTCIGKLERHKGC